jgi:hypothetical protein
LGEGSCLELPWSAVEWAASASGISLRMGVPVARSRQVYIELVVEALLIIFLPEERADTYRHKEIQSLDRPTYSVIQLVLSS